MKNPLRHSIILLLAIFLTTGCSVYHVTSQDTSSDYYPSRRTANEIIFLEVLDMPHDVIGYITVNAERRQKISEVIEKIKREAAILGGDAITHLRTDATGRWKKLPGQDLIGNAYIRANFSATVVVFK